MGIMDTKYQKEYSEIVKKIVCYWKAVRMEDQSRFCFPKEVFDVDVLKNIGEHISHLHLKIKCKLEAGLMTEEENSLYRELVDSGNTHDYHDHSIK